MDEIAILKKWKNGTKWSKIPRLREKNRVFEKSVTKIVTFLKILTPLIFEVKIGPIGFSFVNTNLPGKCIRLGGCYTFLCEVIPMFTYSLILVCYKAYMFP